MLLLQGLVYRCTCSDFLHSFNRSKAVPKSHAFISGSNKNECSTSILSGRSVSSCPTPNLSSAPMPAALAVALLPVQLPVLLPVKEGFLLLFPYHYLITYPITVFLIITKGQQPSLSLPPPQAAAELCPILSFPPVLLQSWVHTLAPVPLAFCLSLDFSLGLVVFGSPCCSHTKFSSSPLARICVHTVYRHLLTLLRGKTEKPHCAGRH